MTDLNKEGLEAAACPFCGTTEHLRLIGVGSLLPDMPDRPYKVVCRHLDCEDVSGPVAYGRHHAIAAWNTRVSSAQSEDVEGVVAELRDAFDGDDVPRKNVALRKSFDLITRLAGERDGLRELAEGRREGYNKLGREYLAMQTERDEARYSLTVARASADAIREEREEALDRAEAAEAEVARLRVAVHELLGALWELWDRDTFTKEAFNNDPSVKFARAALSSDAGGGPTLADVRGPSAEAEQARDKSAIERGGDNA